MSLFKKPKKLALRVFTIENENEKIEGMEVDESPELNIRNDYKEKKKDKKDKSSGKPQKTSLLSFGGDEEEEGETFQVKKSSYSRKIHKERKKHRSNEKSHKNSTNNDSQNSYRGSSKDKDSSPPTTTHITTTAKDSNYIKEIQSDDGFSIRLKNSNPDESLILNGRAALCAGKDEMTSEDEELENDRNDHKFSQPDEIVFKLEAGAIPDAAMIHRARKERQKKREQGEFIALKEKESDEQSKKGKRNVREEDAEGSSEEERVDMSAITGKKELEERRREQFYSVQSEGSENADSDVEMHEWENQQIRKGVTGAQIMSAQQESAFSHYMIPSNNSHKKVDVKPQLTTAELLEQAYSQTNFEIAKHIRKERKKENSSKSGGIKTPLEILRTIQEKLKLSRELNHKHYLAIDRISDEFKTINIDLEECEKSGPQAASKYRYYQEFKFFVEDLVECLNEKVPAINALEEKALNVTSKYSKMLIERRRQDVRDQAKEITDLKTVKKSSEDEERVRRAAEREGRRTRRRRNREKLNMNENHNEGMSSDEEVPDVELALYRDSLAQIKQEAALIFEDVSDEFCQISLILQKFEEWKRKDLNAYTESFFHLCLPKIMNIFVRWYLISWNPLEKSEDIDKMEWFHSLALYGKSDNETEEKLRSDPDVFLIPSIIEKTVIPKLNKIIEDCFDPLSTTQTLKFVKLLNQLSHDYPSLRILSKNLQALFTTVTEKMKLALDNDVFIPIFQKQQNVDARSLFFQRQFFSGIKLFRNFISFQGIISDTVLKSLAISSLLNRYLLSAMRVSSCLEGISKAQTLVLTLPRVWLITADKNFIDQMNLFTLYVSSLESQLDRKHPLYADAIDRLKQILGRLELMVHS